MWFVRLFFPNAHYDAMFDTLYLGILNPKEKNEMAIGPYPGMPPMSETAPHPIARPRVWLVVKQWPGGLREIMKGFMDEEKARYYAGRLIGQDQAMVALETVFLGDED